MVILIVLLRWEVIYSLPLLLNYIYASQSDISHANSATHQGTVESKGRLPIPRLSGGDRGTINRIGGGFKYEGSNISRGDTPHIFCWTPPPGRWRCTSGQ